MNFREELKKNRLTAAPMAGITSAPFRRLLRDFFNGIIYTEMVSAEGLTRGNAGSREFLDMIAETRPSVVQLFGGKPESYPQAIRFVEEYAAPDAYDINMGCPVRKVLKTGGGSALLNDLGTLTKIVRAVRGATEKEFSIKIRLGSDEKNLVYKEVLAIAEGEGVNALVVHARTRRQMFGGVINYEALSQLSAAAKIPVIGNGGVENLESLTRMEETGVSGVMIARAAMRMPWIFKAFGEGKEPSGYLAKGDIYPLILRLHEYMLLHAGDNELKKKHYLNILKKFSVSFTKGLEGSAEFRVKVYQKSDEEYFFEVLEEFFNLTKEG